MTKYASLVLLALSTTLFAQAPKPRKATRAKAAQGQARRAIEQRVKAIEDKDAILKVMYGYAYTVDFGKETQEYTDLYTEDATFLSIAPPAPGSPVPATLEERAALRPATGAVTGRKALEGWIINEWKMRDDLLAKGHYRIHELISPDVTVTGDTASTRAFFQTTDNDNGRIYAVSIGVYKGQMVRGADGHWRIKEWLLIRQGPGNPTGAR